MPKEELRHVNFYMCMDSKSTAMQLLGFPTKKQHARLKDKVKREMHAAHITLSRAQEQTNANINLCWVPGPLLPADINSKSIIGKFTPTKLWNHGPPLFCNNGILNHIYGYYTNGQIIKNPNFKLQEPGAPYKPLNHTESQLVLFTQHRELSQELDTSFSIQQTLRHTHKPLWTSQT